MGVDWVRMKPKDGCDLLEIEEIIKKQALSFQSILSWNDIGLNDDVSQDLLKEIHLSHYLQTSQALTEKITMPIWDEKKVCASDIPDFEISIRNYQIVRNPIFPLLWRIRANSSFLPSQLREIYPLWKKWIVEVNEGKHNDYLKELHLYETCCTMRKHWSVLRNQVLSSNFTKVKEVEKIKEIQEKILILPEPKIVQIHIEPGNTKKVEQNILKEYKEIFNELETLLALTIIWNFRVPNNSKVFYNKTLYTMSLEEFKGFASTTFMSDLFMWLECCILSDFGLFLRY